MRARRAYVTPYPSSPRNYRPPKSSDCVCVCGGGAVKTRRKRAENVCRSREQHRQFVYAVLAPLRRTFYTIQGRVFPCRRRCCCCRRCCWRVETPLRWGTGKRFVRTGLVDLNFSRRLLDAAARPEERPRNSQPIIINEYSTPPRKQIPLFRHRFPARPYSLLVSFRTTGSALGLFPMAGDELFSLLPAV